MNRIWIIGPPGAGKTTLSKKICKLTDFPHIELDSIYWQKNWERSDTRLFIDTVNNFTCEGNWIVDGYYEILHELLQERASMIILIVPSLGRVLYRIVCRSIIRLVTKKLICGENQENVRHLFSREGLLVYAIKQHSFFKRSFGSDYRTKICLCKSNSDVKHIIEAIECRQIAM